MSEFIKEYERAFPNARLSIYQQELIDAEVTDLECWKESIRFWAGNDYRAQSVFKVIQFYKEQCNGTVKPGGNREVLDRSADYYARKYSN